MRWNKSIKQSIRSRVDIKIVLNVVLCTWKAMIRNINILLDKTFWKMNYDIYVCIIIYIVFVCTNLINFLKILYLYINFF